MYKIAGALIIAIAFLATDTMADPGRRGGRKAYAPCNVCHSFTPGQNGWGPSLAGIVGRKAGIVPGFDYSPAMRAKSAAGLVWDEAALNAFIKKPTDFIAGTAMRFPGYPDPKVRHKIFDYLKFRSKR